MLFTHYHGDHIGLYQKIPQDIPLYIGSTAKKLLEILTEKLDSIPKAAEKERGIILCKKMEADKKPSNE